MCHGQIGGVEVQGVEEALKWRDQRLPACLPSFLLLPPRWRGVEPGRSEVHK